MIGQTLRSTKSAVLRSQPKARAILLRHVQGLVYFLERWTNIFHNLQYFKFVVDFGVNSRPSGYRLLNVLWSDPPARSGIRGGV